MKIVAGIKSAQQGFYLSRNLSGYERYELLMKIVAGIRKREKELAETIVRDGGNDCPGKRKADSVCQERGEPCPAYLYLGGRRGTSAGR